MALIQFLFILLMPIVAVGGGLVTLFAVGALFDALEHPEELERRIVAAFKSEPPEGKLTGPDHYYRPYWAR